METKENRYARGKQILRLLYDQGPLDTKSISILNEVPITQAGVREAVNTLKQKGLIVQRFDGLPKNAGNFYQISLAKENRKLISKITGVPESELTEPKIRDQEIYHSQQCAMWCHGFKMLFPNAVVRREFHYMQDEKLINPLFLDIEGYQLKPDILIQFRDEDDEPYVTIAVEIERSRKADERIIRKLKKFASQSHLDGVIYACSEQSMKYVISRLYNKHVVKDANRINNYEKNFMLFSNGQLSEFYLGPVIVNADLKPLSLFHWVNFLKRTPMLDRHDSGITTFG